MNWELVRLSTRFHESHEKSGHVGEHQILLGIWYRSMVRNGTATESIRQWKMSSAGWKTLYRGAGCDSRTG